MAHGAEMKEEPEANLKNPRRQGKGLPNLLAKTEMDASKELFFKLKSWESWDSL